jgi:hypothetical protein
MNRGNQRRYNVMLAKVGKERTFYSALALEIALRTRVLHLLMRQRARAVLGY